MIYYAGKQTNKTVRDKVRNRDNVRKKDTTLAYLCTLYRIADTKTKTKKEKKQRQRAKQPYKSCIINKANIPRDGMALGFINIYLQF
jgi:hypothetical protein